MAAKRHKSIYLLCLLCIFAALHSGRYPAAQSVSAMEFVRGDICSLLLRRKRSTCLLGPFLADRVLGLP
jgi:hypothetical protein